MVAKGRRLVKRVEVESRGVSAAAGNASLLALTHTVSLPPSYDCLLPNNSNGSNGSILLKNCSRLEQRGFAEGHKPSPVRVAFNSGRSMRSNFGSINRSGRESSFSTLSVERRRSR
jgi:hypothetical protein